MGQNIVGWTVLGLLGISAVIGLIFFLLLKNNKKEEEENINIIDLEKLLNSRRNGVSRKSEASRKKERNL